MPRKQAEFVILTPYNVEDEGIFTLTRLPECKSTSDVKKRLGTPIEGVSIAGDVLILQIRAEVKVKLETKTVATFE